jgi:hypothetical protein
MESGAGQFSVLTHPARIRPGGVLKSCSADVCLIFNTAKYQGIDYKRQSALEKRLGTTFC